MSKQQIIVRATSEQKFAFEAASSAAGQSLSAWMIGICWGSIVRGAGGSVQVSEGGETVVVEEGEPRPKQKRDKEGLLPICEKCIRLGAVESRRNYGCFECGRMA